MNKTNISWCDYTWNPIIGCRPVSAGCDNCYAKSLHEKRRSALLAGKKMPEQYRSKFEKYQLLTNRLDNPVRRKKPAKIFVCSMGDFYYPPVPDLVRTEVYNTIEKATWHTYMFLTKRASAQAAYMTKRMKSRAQTYGTAELYPNVWCGMTAETQRYYDMRKPLLDITPAVCRWASLEPLLGPIEITPGLNWVVVGCESGQNARPCKEEWIRQVVDRCKTLGIPVYVKQMKIDNHITADINRFPKWAQVRQYPVRRTYDTSKN
jgi:protein gp37